MQSFVDVSLEKRPLGRRGMGG